MQLTEDQQSQVRQWAEEGASLGEIQKRMESEFEITMPYMEVRFLVSDLQISIQDPDKPKEPEESTSDLADLGVDDDDDDELPGDPLGALGGGNVSVTIDEIMRPNTVVSGKATFSDGEVAVWFIDAMGQLGLEPTTEGYRPSEEDFMAFQQELQKAARKAGL